MKYKWKNDEYEWIVYSLSLHRTFEEIPSNFIPVVWLKKKTLFQSNLGIFWSKKCLFKEQTLKPRIAIWVFKNKMSSTEEMQAVFSIS